MGILILIMLLIMIVVRRRILAQKLRSSRKSLQQTHEHFYDPNELLFGRNHRCCGGQLSGDKNIKTCRAFEGGAAGNFKETAAVSIREFAVGLRDVERNSRRSPIQLIFSRGLRGDAGEKLANPAAQ